MTSKPHGHPEALPLTAGDFAVGGPLPHSSFVLPHRLVTANESVVRKTVGVLSATALDRLRTAVCRAVCANG